MRRPDIRPGDTVTYRGEAWQVRAYSPKNPRAVVALFNPRTLETEYIAPGDLLKSLKRNNPSV